MGSAGEFVHEGTSEDRMIGLVIQGRYRVDALLGKGGMGAVYRAKQLSVDRDVAVKVLIPAVSTDERLVARFENEAKIIAQLQHPHTLKLIEFGRMDDGRLFIVTEFLRGETLQQRLRRSGSLEVPVLLAVLRQLSESLIEAHAHEVVHRDLKPGNLFLQRVGDQEILKVLDFGIAKLGHQSQMTATGAVFGTPAYMSPEQARGERVDARADLYSIGIIAYECLTGRPPFEGDSMPSVLIKHIMDPVPPLDAHPRGPELPVALKALVMRLLAKTPVERPEGAVALRAAVDEILTAANTAATPRLGALTLSAPLDEPLGALAGTGPASSGNARSTLRRRRRRQRTLALAVPALLLAIGAGLGARLSEGPPGATPAGQSEASTVDSRPPEPSRGPGLLVPLADPPAAEALVGPTDAGATGADVGEGPQNATAKAPAIAPPGSSRIAPVDTKSETQLDAVVRRRLPTQPAQTPEVRPATKPEPADIPSPSAARVPPGLIPVSLEPPK